jgi:alkylation response protein AidB-like acyl-CoA dehydrogenase
MTTLGNERGGNATTQHVAFTRQFWDAVDLARKLGRETDPLVRQQLAWAYTHCEIMRFQGLRILADVVARKEPGPASALNKMFWSEYAQRFAEVVNDLRGAEATVMPGDPADGYQPDRWQQAFLATRAVTIWGGTAQVQRNIVGERVLGLPKEPDPTKQRRTGPTAQEAATS